MQRPSRRSVASGMSVSLALVALASAALAQPAPRPVTVRFELNDAQVKGRALEGVTVTVSPAGGGERSPPGGRAPTGAGRRRCRPGRTR